MDCTSASTQSESPIPGGSPEVSIIVPARNEEVSLGDCLRSLVNQTGVNFEIIVVDDGSTDQTCVIAESFPGVRVISVGVLPPGWTGKNNAVAAGAREATGSWLLFTDADTIHVPGSLARSLAEAKTENADMLSYSPEQIVGSFAEKVVTPVVFAELASEYPPEKVREEHSGVAAANGQYILVRRAAYEMAGGHTAVAKEILEDVVLAKIFRRTGLRVFFRYGGDAVRARMYHNWAQLRDGWTKNLALLFPYPRRRAAILTAWWLIGWLTLPLLIPAVGLFWRIRRAHFSLSTTILATAFGPPVFAFLLLRSRSAHLDGKVSWKGRDYAQSGLTHSAIHEAVRKGKPVLRTNS
jgi:glycosyltransferase involved in cell wall biosynthesis